MPNIKNDETYQTIRHGTVTSEFHCDQNSDGTWDVCTTDHASND
jgi:subtilisin-like proprotein convertase family protein